jgi:hypothetical protein
VLLLIQKNITNNNNNNNKYDTYISKAKVLINQYHTSNHSQPINIQTIPIFSESNVTSPKNKNVFKIQSYTTIQNSLNNTLHNKQHSYCSYNNSINNSIRPNKSSSSKTTKTKKQISNNKRRELMLNLTHIDNPLPTHKSNPKHKSLNINYETPIQLNKEHISRKSTEISNLLTHINTNDKLNSHLEKIFGNEYIYKLINSNVNDGYIEKIQKESEMYMMLSSTQTYADKLLNWNNNNYNKYNIHNGVNISIGKKSNHNVNNTLIKTFETTKVTNVSKKQKPLNKTISTFKHKRKLK